MKCLYILNSKHSRYSMYHHQLLYLIVVTTRSIVIIKVLTTVVVVNYHVKMLIAVVVTQNASTLLNLLNVPHNNKWTNQNHWNPAPRKIVQRDLMNLNHHQQQMRNKVQNHWKNILNLLHCIKLVKIMQSYHNKDCCYNMCMHQIYTE